MGLDSVELVMNWENFFQIDIPDLEASKMATVGDAVNYISTHVSYVDRGHLFVIAVALNNLKPIICAIHFL